MNLRSLMLLAVLGGGGFLAVQTVRPPMGRYLEVRRLMVALGEDLAQGNPAEPAIRAFMIAAYRQAGVTLQRSDVNLHQLVYGRTRLELNLLLPYTLPFDTTPRFWSTTIEVDTDPGGKR